MEVTLTTQTGETVTARLIPSTGNAYAATTDARILRLKDNGTARELKQYPVNKGYRGVTIHRKQRPVHRLVCEAFHGPAPRPGMDVAHWNGNRADNRPENLRWATRDENIRDQLRHGTHWSQRKQVSPWLHQRMLWKEEAARCREAWDQFKTAKGIK